jgi:hypothetical protein
MSFGLQMYKKAKQLFLKDLKMVRGFSQWWWGDFHQQDVSRNMQVKFRPLCSSNCSINEIMLINSIIYALKESSPQGLRTVEW